MKNLDYIKIYNASAKQMLTYSTVADSERMSDIFINPELLSTEMLTFNEESINLAYDAGYSTAKGHNDELLKLKELVGDSRREIKPEEKAVNLNKRPVSITNIGFEGIDAESELILEKKIAKILRKRESDMIGRFQIIFQRGSTTSILLVCRFLMIPLLARLSLTITIPTE